MEITTQEVKVTDMDGEAGTCFDVECPECHEHIKVADYGWWDMDCKCGYKWSVSVIATGQKFDE
jgi:hypothetical protein